MAATRAYRIYLVDDDRSVRTSLTRLLRVSGFDVPFPPAKLEGVYLPDADRVLEAVDRALDY